MAILTTSGRAALAAAIKQQPLHLALGEGETSWDTPKEISGAFDAENKLQTGSTHISGVVVKSGAATYSIGDDYTVNAATGTLNRVITGTIPEGGEVSVSFMAGRPPEDTGRTALLREVGRRVVDEVHFVSPDPAGEIVVPTGRYTISIEPTNHLFVRVRFDFEDAATNTIREQGLFVGTGTNEGLPVGQKFFIPAQIEEPGILLILQHSVPIVRQPSTRETFEFVVTF